MCGYYLSLIVLPTVLRVCKLEPEVSVVGNAIVVAFFPSGVQTGDLETWAVMIQE